MRVVQAVLIFVAVSVASCELHVLHNDGKMLPHVRIGAGASGHRSKRQASRMPLRITPFYDSTVNGLQANKRQMIMNDIVPSLISFLRQLLRVTPSAGVIRLNNQCSGTSGMFYIFGDGRVACPQQCATTTRCGVFQVGTDHLQQCLQCNGQKAEPCAENPVVGTPSQSGSGIANTDFVLYISANQTACPPVPPSGPTTVALASHCQLEASMDRPVAGNVNFCPEGIARDVNGLQYISAVTKHELLHALGFSSSLFPFWHDSNGNPRTRRQGNRLPTVAGTSTVRNLTYTQWQTRSGMVQHSVTALVTPAVVLAAQRHFGCNSLMGVELENQGVRGTAVDHWEKRILGNEAMTGVFTFNPVFSNITLAALYDTGWYDVNFSMAEELVWGRGKGCRFVQGSCVETIDRQLRMANTANGVFPFCNVTKRFGCTVDRLSVAQCNLNLMISPSETDFQYFSDPRSGGNLVLADYCPFYQSVQFQTRTPVCSEQSNTPAANNLLEQYGSTSRCLIHGREWSVAGRAIQTYGGGCYQYSCSRTSGVTITVNGRSHTCNCTGEEVIIDENIRGVKYFGSVICPACEDICHDSLDQCPTTGTRSCYGRIDSSAQATFHLIISVWTTLLSLSIYNTLTVTD